MTALIPFWMLLARAETIQKCDTEVIVGVQAMTLRKKLTFKKLMERVHERILLPTTTV